MIRKTSCGQVAFCTSFDCKLLRPDQPAQHGEPSEELVRTFTTMLQHHADIFVHLYSACWKNCHDHPQLQARKKLHAHLHRRRFCSECRWCKTLHHAQRRCSSHRSRVWRTAPPLSRRESCIQSLIFSATAKTAWESSRTAAAAILTSYLVS